jgi:hypothetical protein
VAASPDRMDSWIQCRGYIDAINFAQTLDCVDATRLALWGDSYTGVQVVVVGACDARVMAIVAQCPIFGPELPAVEPSRENFEIIKATLRSGDVRGTPETTIGPMPVVSPDQAGTPSLLKPIQAFRWFIEYGGRPSSRWINSATRVIPPTSVTYNPVLCAPFVKVPSCWWSHPRTRWCTPTIPLRSTPLTRCPDSSAGMTSQMDISVCSTTQANGSMRLAEFRLNFFRSN